MLKNSEANPKSVVKLSLKCSILTKTALNKIKHFTLNIMMRLIDHKLI